MMTKTLRWGRSILGYSLYTVAVLVVMLWVLFPVNFVQQWIPAYFNARFPHANVALAKVEIVFPGKLLVTGLEISTSAGRNELLKVATLQLQPEMRTLWSLQPQIHYTATVGEGRVFGTIMADSSFTFFDVTGQLQDVQLDAVSFIKKNLEREIQGKLNAQCEGKVQSDFTSLSDLEMKVSIDNGSIGLKQAILGHDSLSFSEMHFIVTGNEEKLFVEEGQVESELFTADFRGKIEPRIPYASSSLSFAGTMVPRTEFFAYVTDGKLLSALRNQLHDDGAAFQISGDFAHPGINFGELSSLFQAAAPPTAEQ